MPLTKRDLFQIKEIVDGGVETLAVLVNKGFTTIQKHIEALDKRIELLEKRIEIIEREIQHVNARLDALEHDVADIKADTAVIKKHFVYRDEFEEIVARLSVVEKKLGIKAGR